MEIYTNSDVAFMYHFRNKFNFIFNFKKIYSHKIQHKPCNLVKTNNSDCHLLNIHKGRLKSNSLSDGLFKTFSLHQPQAAQNHNAHRRAQARAECGDSGNIGASHIVTAHGFHHRISRGGLRRGGHQK